MKPEKAPKIGDRKIVEGREYIFLQTSGKPTWHSPEELDQYRGDIEARRMKKKLRDVGINPKRPTKEKPMDPNPFEEKEDDDQGMVDNINYLAREEKTIEDGAPEQQEETALVDEDPKPKVKKSEAV